MTGTGIPQRVTLAGGHFVPEFPDECEPHTDSPRGYLQWHDWAERMGRSHVQRQCRGCGLWVVWERRPGASGLCEVLGDEERSDEEGG